MLKKIILITFAVLIHPSLITASEQHDDLDTILDEALNDFEDTTPETTHMSSQTTSHMTWDHFIEYFLATNPTQELTTILNELINKDNCPDTATWTRIYDLIRQGANFNTQNTNGQQCLFFAAKYGQADVVKLLLKHGANVDIKDKYSTPLHIAILYDHTDIVKLLLEHNADPNNKDNSKSTPLHWAATTGNTEITKLLLAHGANVHDKDDCNNTPLHFATAHNRTEIAKLLLQHGANIHDKDDCDETALHNAAKNGNTDIVKLLLAHGANVHDKNDDNNTPLHLAALYDHTKIAKILISYGATGSYINEPYRTTIKQLAQNPQALQTHPEKLLLACTLVAHQKTKLITQCFHHAHFAQKESQAIIQHLGYLCPNLEPHYCTQIVWLLPILTNKSIQTILTNLPLEKQRLQLAHVLQINKLCTMQSKQALCDVTFIFE